MHFEQIHTPGLAHSSYVIGTGNKCVVVDPGRKIEPYLEKAESFGMDIVAIIETHLHADFVSGHMDLAEETGAEIYAPETANCDFPHRALKDNEEFKIENLKFQLLETPGHTPDCAVYLVTDLERGDEPILAFTGDTLLVGSVGRPDLFPDKEVQLAEQLFNSLNRLKSLPDYIEIYPAHGMGSLCGRSLSAKLSSTIGIEKLQNYTFKHDDLESFKFDLLTDMPPAPDHFSRCTEINRQGPKLIKDLDPLKPVLVEEFKEAINANKIVLDARSYISYASAHIPGSYSISIQGNFATFSGWVLPPDKDIILVMEREEDLQKIVQALHSVGLDNIHGYLKGGIIQWILSGEQTKQVEPISVGDVIEYINSDSETVVLDNRAESEWKDGHIPGSILAPTPDVRYKYQEWDVDTPIITMCSTSIRSMTAASILKQKGFKRVMNFFGGTTAWEAAGYDLKPGGDG